MFTKHNGYGFVSEFFAFNWYVFMALTNKKFLASVMMKAKQNILWDHAKSTEYSASAINLELSNPRVRPLARIKISLFLLSISINELISTPVKSGIEKIER